MSQPQQQTRAKDATPALTQDLCDSITRYLQAAKTSQTKQKRKERKSPINGSLFILMWRLVSILELTEWDKRVLLTTPSHLTSLQTMVSELFKGLFCQKALSLFEKSEYYRKSWLSLLRKDLSSRMTEMQLVEIEELLDKNAYGDLSSSRMTASPPHIAGPQATRGLKNSVLQENTSMSKDLYEVTVDLAVFVIVRLSTAGQAGEGKHTEAELAVQDAIDPSMDFLSHVVAAFVKHVRQHETLNQRASNKAKPAAKEDGGAKSYDILTCLPSALSFLKLVQLSRRLQVASVKKELANKLFGVLPGLFQLDDAVMLDSSRGLESFDLNQLIAQQGRTYTNNASNNQGQITAGRPLLSVPDGIATGQGGAITMESGRSNTLRGMQQSPSKSPAKNQLTNEDQDRGRFRKKTEGRQIGNFRANSEPPNEIGMHYIHSQEDLKASKEFAGTFTKGDEQKLLQLNLNQAVIASSATRNRNIHKVPPILVNKIQNLNMSSAHQAAAQNNFQSTNSSLVMNNFFNMPHGQLYQTSNTVQGGSHPPQGADKTSQYKFVSQPTIAKSRLTRRQQSMTKTSANNLSSYNLHGKHGTNLSVNLTNLAGSGAHKGATGDTSPSGAVNALSAAAAAAQANQNNPYRDASEEGLGSKRSTSAKPKVPVPTLNFTKVLKQTGVDSRSNNAPGTLNQTNSMSPFPGTAVGAPTSHLASAVSTNPHKFMNAQQATSISNNAFIANNFLVPNLVSRTSNVNVQQTRSSRSPVSAQLRNGGNAEKTGTNIRETESIFDDVNGSFALDPANEGANQLEFINAEERLQNLAIQLGESCLTADLGALMSQKRDLELVESARKILQKRPSFVRQWTQSNLGVQRSMSQQHQDIKNGDSSLRNSRGSLARGETLRNQKTSLVQRANEILNKDKVQSRQHQRVRYRVVLLNIIDTVLACVNNDEARFLRQPLSLLSSYLESSYFREQRDKKQIRELQQVVKAPQKNKIRLPLDTSQLELLFGSSSFPGSVEDSDKFFMTNDGQTCKLSQLQQNKIEGDIVPPAVDLTVDSDFIQVETQDINRNSIYFGRDYNTRERLLSQKQTVLLSGQDVFKAICMSEVKVVSRLLCKFQFVNEDILRSQVMNELSSFTNRDRMAEGKLFASLMPQSGFPQASYNNQLNSSQLGLPGGLSPSKMLHNIGSFELEQEALLLEMAGGPGPKSGKLLAHQTLQHPQCFWSNNGIAYEVQPAQSQSILSSAKQASAALVSRESIRQKLDSVLYQVNRRIRFIFSQGYDMTDYEFSDALTAQIVTLNAYLEEQQSRTILHQVIDVCLEPLLMVKKALIEVSLNTNILVMDFTKNMNFTDLLISAKGTATDVGGSDSDHLGLKMRLLKRQSRLRDLFAEFLQLCSILLKAAQSPDTLKLLNETLIYDEMWQEGVKTFVIALFLSDLVGPVTAHDLNHFQRQHLEDLRGVNIVNFQQSFFFGNMAQVREPKLYELAKESVNRSLLAAKKFLKYLKAVARLYNSAISLYFPQTFDQRTKQKQSKNLNPSAQGGISTGQPYSNMGFVPNYLPGQTQPKQPAGKDDLGKGRVPDFQQTEAEKQRNQKYWKHVIRKVLYQLMFLITQPNGLFYQYLQNNATNYANHDLPAGQGAKLSKSQKLGGSSRQDSDDWATYQQVSTPVNLCLTRSMLAFMERIFALPERFTKYVFDEELLLFYIRTNYISFVKLYNKNFSITKQVEDIQVRSSQPDATRMTFEELASPDEQEKNQKLREVRKQASLSLCKKLLACLFAIARNRNEDTRRKLFQFKIVQFLLQEVGLEFEVQQRRYKFLKLSKEQTVPAQPQATEQLQHLAPAQTQAPPPEPKPEPVQVKANPINRAGGGFKIPPLKTGGLGFSTLLDADGKTQEEKDVENIVSQNQAQPKPVAAPVQSEQPIQGDQPPAPVKKKPFIPPLLGAKNLGMSTLMNADGKTQEELDVEATVKQNANPKPMAQPVQQVAQQPIAEETKAPQIEAQPAPSATKKKPFIPPLLGAKNLGMSTLVQANGKTMEENDVDNTVKSNMVKPAPAPQQPPQQIQSQQEHAPPQPPKKKPFIPPLLGAKNLGMSTLIQENGKTKEEMDVENQVQQNKFTAQAQPAQTQPVIAPAQSAQPTAQQAQPPALVKKKPFIPPLLGAKNLGMSTLIQENGKTQEEMDVENQDNQNYHAYQGSRVPQAQPQQPSQAPPAESDRTDDSEVRRKFGIQTQQEESKDSAGNARGNNDGDESSSDESYYAEMARIRAAKEAEEAKAPVQQSKKRFVPLLGVKNLGLSTLTKDGQNKTQEELDVERNVAESRGLAIPTLQKNHTQPPTNQQPEVQVSKNAFVKPDKTADNLAVQSQGSQPQINAADSLAEGVMILNGDEAEASKRTKLQNHRKGLIRQSRSNMRRNAETEEARSKAVTRNHAYQSEMMGDGVGSVQSPQNVISGFHEHSQGNTIMQSASDLQMAQLRGSITGAAKDQAMLSPPSQNSEDRSRSVTSNGSHVGRNKVYVPHLSFPEDINVDPREKRKVHAKPKGEARFNLQKSTTNTSIGGKKGAYGKKSKLLEFNLQAEGADQNLLEEPLEDSQPLNASRGGPTDPFEAPKASVISTIQESLGGDSIKSNKIKKISFLKGSLHSQGKDQQSQMDSLVHSHNLSQQQPPQMEGVEASEARSFVEQKEVSEELFYLKERGVRPIYQDDELHVMMLSLIMCLMLKPERGTLDELYCSQFPIHDDNQNILYLLHWHLSHPANQKIVPSLLAKMEQVSPPLAGIRLLKLMCPSLFDISLYNNGKGWRKLAAGQYGIVYECETKFARPQSVAIKQMSLPQSISDRCVLHDIFTEITCLEEFRLEPCVTDLFDYGVDQTSYYIVMKKYSGSLREWRLRQKPNIMDNLSLYLSIYREVLKAFKVIQSHNVTHYDIKCDNILIDFKGSHTATDQGAAPSGPAASRYGQAAYREANDSRLMFEQQQISSDEFSITVGDFGTCHMYYSDKDEFLVSDRGTPNIKSPEMIELELNKRTDTDKYDRRKRVGTSRLSDVWGLGCLFYELLTGDMLFDADEYAWFFVRLTKYQLDLFEEGRLQKINNNVYLIDFLKYILVRDPRMRPTIDNVLKRFEHVYALLVATHSGHARFSRLQPAESEIFTQRGSKVSLQQMLLQTAQIMLSEADKSGDKELSLSAICADGAESQRVEMPTLMRVMEDVFISSISWLRRSPARVVRLGITHIVIPEHLVDRQISDKFNVYAIPTHVSEVPNPKEVSVNPFSVMPAVMDFLRQAALFKGRVLFVERHEDWTALGGTPTRVASDHGSDMQHLVRECMLMCLAAIYQTSAYETYTLIKSQNLFFAIEARRLQKISEFTQLCASIQHYLSSYPKFSCMCGSCVLVLKRQFATYQNTQLLACACQHYYKNVASDPSQACPSPGCADFIAFLRAFYRDQTEQRGLLPENQLLWGFFEEEDFIFGPNFSGVTDNYQQRQLAASISMTIDRNSVLVAVTDKGRSGGPATGLTGNAGGSGTPSGNIDLISRSSATRRNYSRQGGSALGTHGVHGAGSQRWKLFKCRQCQVWTYAYNELESRYAVLLNNRVKDQRLSRLGLLAGQEDDEMSMGQGETAAVRVPILKNIKLKIPF